MAVRFGSTPCEVAYQPIRFNAVKCIEKGLNARECHDVMASKLPASKVPSVSTCYAIYNRMGVGFDERPAPLKNDKRSGLRYGHLACEFAFGPLAKNVNVCIKQGLNARECREFLLTKLPSDKVPSLRTCYRIYNRLGVGSEDYI